MDHDWEHGWAAGSQHWASSASLRDFDLALPASEEAGPARSSWEDKSKDIAPPRSPKFRRFVDLPPELQLMVADFACFGEPTTFLAGICRVSRLFPHAAQRHLYREIGIGYGLGPRSESPLLQLPQMHLLLRTLLSRPDLVKLVHHLSIFSLSPHWSEQPESFETIVSPSSVKSLVSNESSLLSPTGRGFFLEMWENKESTEWMVTLAASAVLLCLLPSLRSLRFTRESQRDKEPVGYLADLLDKICQCPSKLVAHMPNLRDVVASSAGVPWGFQQIDVLTQHPHLQSFSTVLHRPRTLVLGEPNPHLKNLRLTLRLRSADVRRTVRAFARVAPNVEKLDLRIDLRLNLPSGTEGPSGHDRVHMDFERLGAMLQEAFPRLRSLAISFRQSYQRLRGEGFTATTLRSLSGLEQLEVLRMPQWALRAFPWPRNYFVNVFPTALRELTLTEDLRVVRRQPERGRTAAHRLQERLEAAAAKGKDIPRSVKKINVLHDETPWEVVA